MPSRDPRPAADPEDFALEHAQPAQGPVTPAADAAPGPLEGLDSDLAGWGRKAQPTLWERFTAWRKSLG